MLAARHDDDELVNKYCLALTENFNRSKLGTVTPQKLASIIVTPLSLISFQLSKIFDRDKNGRKVGGDSPVSFVLRFTSMTRWLLSGI